MTVQRYVKEAPAPKAKENGLESILTPIRDETYLPTAAVRQQFEGERRNREGWRATAGLSGSSAHTRRGTPRLSDTLHSLEAKERCKRILGWRKSSTELRLASICSQCTVFAVWSSRDALDQQHTAAINHVRHVNSIAEDEHAHMYTSHTANISEIFLRFTLMQRAAQRSTT